MGHVYQLARVWDAYNFNLLELSFFNILQFGMLFQFSIWLLSEKEFTVYGAVNWMNNRYSLLLLIIN